MIVNRVREVPAAWSLYSEYLDTETTDAFRNGTAKLYQSEETINGKHYQFFLLKGGKIEQKSSNDGAP